MGDLLTFKKIDYSLETEQITKKAFGIAFWPLKISIIIGLVCFVVYFISGNGNIVSFSKTQIFLYIILAFFLSSIWLVMFLRLGLKCPSCGHPFFRLSRSLEIKPRCCPDCGVVFIKKTHPLEDDYDYSNEFYLLHVELERRANMILFYMTIAVILMVYILIPFLAAILGETISVIIISPILLIILFLYFQKQLETRCPSCSEIIRWTDLRPTEDSRHCPKCGVKLAN